MPGRASARYPVKPATPLGPDHVNVLLLVIIIRMRMFAIWEAQALPFHFPRARARAEGNLMPSMIRTKGRRIRREREAGTAWFLPILGQMVLRQSRMSDRGCVMVTLILGARFNGSTVTSSQAGSLTLKRLMHVPLILNGCSMIQVTLTFLISTTTCCGQGSAGHLASSRFSGIFASSLFPSTIIAA
jgi:hypothetical protein